VANAKVSAIRSATDRVFSAVRPGSERQHDRQDRYTRTEAALRVPMLALALALLPVLLLPVFVPDPGPDALTALDIAGVALWAAFVPEYLVLLAPQPPPMARTGCAVRRDWRGDQQRQPPAGTMSRHCSRS
jgi:hypothetical protein